MVDDDLDWRGDEVQAALDRFGAILGYADPDASGLTWDQATRKLATGGCAFESMNDSAFGELVAAGAQEGEDFGAVPFPGTGAGFLAVVDVFVAATKAENAKNALAFLGGIERAGHAAPVQQGEGVGPGRPRRGRGAAPGLPAGVVEGALDAAGAALRRAR